MSAKSQSRLPDLLTGLFVLAVVALLAFFTIVISGVDILRGRHDVLREARFDSVGTLRTQDPVTVRGMKVGTVQSLCLAQDHVIVTFSIDASVPLQSDAHAAVASTSVLGGSALALDQGVSPESLPEDAVLPGRAPNDVMNELGELLSDLRQSFNPADVRTLIVNLRGTSANLADITGRIRSGEGLLGQLLDNDAPLSVDLQATLANLRQASDSLNDPDTALGALLSEGSPLAADLQATAANLRDVSQRLNDGRGLLGKLLAEDDKTYEDLQATLANLNAATAALNDPNAPLGKLLGGDSTLIDDLEATAANLRAITQKTNDGQGTLGKLVNDQALADEAEAAIKDVRQIIDNMRDTAPITSFTSLFFGGL